MLIVITVYTAVYGVSNLYFSGSDFHEMPKGLPNNLIRRYFPSTDPATMNGSVQPFCLLSLSNILVTVPFHSLWHALYPSHLSQLLCRDVPVPVPVEDPECLPDVVAALVLLDLLAHHRKELLELDGTVAVDVDLKELESAIGFKRFKV